MVEVPTYFFYKNNNISIEIDQIQKLPFIDLIMTNRMQKTERFYL
jgi:hypothetical protein